MNIAEPLWSEEARVAPLIGEKLMIHLVFDGREGGFLSYLSTDAQSEVSSQKTSILFGPGGLRGVPRFWNQLKVSFPLGVCDLLEQGKPLVEGRREEAQTYGG